jgi:hypothetical protein
MIRTLARRRTAITFDPNKKLSTSDSAFGKLFGQFELALIICLLGSKRLNPILTVSTSGNSGIVPYIVSAILISMDSLNDILSRKDLDEPPEIGAIKRYVRLKFQTDVGVSIQHNTIVITAANAALSSNLRMQTPQLQKEADTSKKIIIRIGR